MTRLVRCTWLFIAVVALAAFVPTIARAQAVLTGHVSGEQGQAITGASVQINELNIAVPVDASGNFTITVPEARVNGQTVVVRTRAIGYKPDAKTVLLQAGRQTLTFTLARDVTQLSEVVVTGVAVATQQVKLPFTVNRLDSAAMPVTGTSPINQLQGKIPGATVVSASGRPGSAPAIILRGPVSLNATGRTQQPLYLIDGVPVLNQVPQPGTFAAAPSGGLPDINPADIESIEILKGAAAASLYGARAGAGVVNITTKSGKNAAAGVRFGLRTEVGGGDVEKAFPLATKTALFLDPTGQYFCTRESVGGSPCARYIDWDREVQRINNNGQDFSGSPQTFAGEADFAVPPGYDQLTSQFMTTPWPKMRDPVAAMITPGMFANTSLDMRARVNNTGVYASYGNLVQEGPVQFTGGFLRNSVRLNVDQRFTDRISATINSFYSQSRDNSANIDLEGAGSGSPFFNITRAPWMADLEARDALGRIVVRHNPLAQGEQNRNPLYLTAYQPRTDKSTRFVGGGSLRYTPLEWLNMDANIGYDRATGSAFEMRDRGWRTTLPDPANAVGYVYIPASDNQQLTTSGAIAANKTFFNDLNATFSTRYVYSEQSLTSQDEYAEDVVVPGLSTITATTKNYAVTSSKQEIRDMGFFFGGDFDWKDRYVLNALVRRDGSSLFGAGNRWATFGRIAGAWIASREPWWPAKDALSLFKLRASEGSTGQRPRFNAQYETFTIGTSTSTINPGVGTLNPSQLGNRELKPEVNREVELGGDFEFFHRLVANISYSRARIDQQILPVKVPSASGFSSRWLNAGELTNKTVEATFTLPVLTRATFNWTARLIYDRTQSKITRLDVPPFTGDITAGNTFTVFKFREGETVGTMYGVDFVRNCSQLPTGFSTQCSMNGGDLNAAFRPNDQGYIVWVGAGNQLTDGITRNLWRSRLEVGQGPWGNRTNWGMPIALRDSTNAIANVPVGNALPKYHWGLSQTVDWKRLNFYGLLDAARGLKLFNVQRAWSLGDLQVSDVDQFGADVGSAKPIGYYWRQGPSSSPTAGSTAGVGGFYDVLGPNTFNTEDASYVKLREASVTFNVGEIGGRGDWKIGFIGRNLKTWTKFHGFDPESGNTTGPLNSAALTGVAGYRYPKMRTYTVQLSTSF
ncbi:MAG TPA: SusC/RagA family TonB-linked outer membrane protein [Gemmatimonadaceae bacterium]|nr:SusC/RagA family TonB-linked outer membrane protein [Gemmatimonadaceae bacterium]